jgi:hypothetical protein
MKKILFLCGSILAIGAAYLVWRYLQPEHYGRPFNGARSVSIAQIAANGTEGEVRVEGKIVRQCPVSGCWFYLADGKGHQFKVDFGKVLPNLPQKIGRQAIVEGQWIKSEEEPMLAGSAVEFR